MTITPQSLIRSGLLTGALVTSLALGACSSSDSDSGGSSPVKKEQTITFSAPMTLGVGESAALTATASSELEVTYASTTPEVCEVSEKTVLAKAIGECSLTASQAGNTGFKPADDVSVSFAVISATVSMSGTDTLRADEESKISMSGKQVTQNLTATLAGETIPVSSTGDYSAQISVTPTMAGDVPLLVKDGDTVLIDELLQVALPEATGDSFTVKKTGATKCGNLTENNIDCSDQDKLGEFYQTNQDGEVQAGADPTYIKVAHQVERDGEKSMEYCIYDKATGLMWEQKTDDGGLRDKDWRYSWYDSNPATNGGATGKEVHLHRDGTVANHCESTLAKCNSEVYISKLNEINYCGHSDWRVPKGHELYGLFDFGKTEQPYIADVFTNIAIAPEPDVYGENTTGIYMASDTFPTNERYKEIGYQFFPTIAFSQLNSRTYRGNKGDVSYHILAVR